MNQKRSYEPSKDLALLREVSLELKNGSDSFDDYEPIRARVKKSVSIALKVAKDSLRSIKPIEYKG